MSGSSTSRTSGAGWRGDTRRRGGRRRRRAPRPSPWKRWATTAVGLGVLAGASWWITTSELFEARTLRVTGNERLGRERVLEVAGVSARTNVLWLSPGAVEARLEASPWIRSARVSRALPATLAIAVEERRPVAVAASSRPYLVAADGTVLGPGRARDLPRVDLGSREPTVGRRVRAPTLAVVSALPPSLRPLVARVGYERRSLVLALRGGGRAIFGDATDAEGKGEALAAVLRWAERNGVVPEYVDVRAPSHPALRPAGGGGPGAPDAVPLD